MNGDAEGLLERLPARGAPPALRDRVLAGVTRELETDADCGARRERLAAALAAALVLVGLTSVMWTTRRNERRLAELTGPKPLPRAVAETVEMVETVAGPDAKQWIRRSLADFYETRSVSLPEQRRHVERLIRELELTREETRSDQVQEIPQERGDWPRRGDRDSADRQRGAHLDLRRTA